MVTNYTKRIYIIFIVCLCHILSVSAQSNINKTADSRAESNIISSTGFTYKIEEDSITKDSSISVKRMFNSKGYRTETSIYDDHKITSKYEFDYLSDTLISARRYYNIKDDVLRFISETKYEYNKKNQIKKQYDSYTNSEYKRKEKYKYNKKGQLTKEVLSVNKKKIKDNQYKYGDNGEISMVIKNIPTKETFIYKYDNFDRLLKVYKKYSDGSKKIVKYFDYSEDGTTTRHILNTTTTVLGIHGRTKLWRTDVLTTICTFDEFCQLKEEKEYLNGELNGHRKYYYNL